MFRSWKLGTAFGIGIYLHWTFLILLAFVFLGDLRSGQVGTAVFEAALVGAIFGSVVLHELGHALMARHYGIATRDITLYPIGGVARLERLSERPIEEFWISLAGPAVNVGIAGLLVGLLSVGGLNLVALPSWSEANFLWALLFSNLVLVAFNLLPAFPSDGGRVLRALLAIRLGRLRATRIAAAVGAGMAALLFLIGAFPGLVGSDQSMPMLMLVSLFLYFAGRQELAFVERQSMLRAGQPLEMSALPDGSYDVDSSTVTSGFSGFTWDSHSRLWVQWQNGRPVHTITVE
jgi:Zn-dependent protease